MHLMVGSEGTLGFIAEVTLRTVPEHAHKASALLFFADIGDAARAVQAIKAGPVAAAELMDRASLRSVENEQGMPAILKTLGREACALLVETRASEPAALEAQRAEIERLLRSVPTAVGPEPGGPEQARLDVLERVEVARGEGRK